MRASRLRLPLLVCGLALMPLAAAAQDYPTKTIKIIVPNPPGGAGDISARLIGQKLSEIFHQPVIVENQAGRVGLDRHDHAQARRSPTATPSASSSRSSQTIDRIQNKTASFDIAKDFTPITAIANNPAGLLVNDQIPAKTMAEFIADVRKKPGTITYGTAGIGTAHHLYGEVLNKVAGIKMLNVPYRGRGAGVQRPPGRPRAGRDRQPCDHAAAHPERQGAAPHRVRHQALCQGAGCADHHRGPAELSAPGRAWVGFLGAARRCRRASPRGSIAEIVRILKSPEVLQSSARTGSTSIANTPAEFAVMIREDAKIWDEAAVIAGLLRRNRNAGISPRAACRTRPARADGFYCRRPRFRPM